MSLTFYCGSGSPYAWRVWLALEHKGLEYELKMMSFSEGDLKTPEYAAINPRRKVPAILDDGFALYESAAILEYLDEAHVERGASLFPGGVQARAIVRRMVQEADQYIAPAMERIVDQVLFTAKENWNLDRIARARTALAGELGRWETSPRGDWLAGSEPSAADFTLYPLIALTQRMQRRKPDLEVEAMLGPRMRSWMQRVEALPYFRKTWPPHWS